MRRWFVAGIVLACVATAGIAAACPLGSDPEIRPTRTIQNVSLQVSELFERANQLEAVATSEDVQARSLEQEANVLSNRARLLRTPAGLVSTADRGSIFAIAVELASRADVLRARAVEARSRASELRAEAQTLRQRAVALSRGSRGDGWRKRTVSGDLPALTL
jgi:hypothetical protein